MSNYACPTCGDTYALDDADTGECRKCQRGRLNARFVAEALAAAAITPDHFKRIRNAIHSWLGNAYDPEFRYRGNPDYWNDDEIDELLMAIGAILRSTTYLPLEHGKEKAQ